MDTKNNRPQSHSSTPKNTSAPLPKNADFIKQSSSSLDNLEKVEDKLPKSKKVARIVTTFVFLLLLGSMVALTVFGIGIYKYKWPLEDKTISKVIEYIPFPAARVNYQFISLKEYKANLDALNKYYAATGASDNAELEQQKEEVRASVLDRLIDTDVINELNKSHEIAVSQEEIDVELDRVVEQTGSREDVEKTLNELYGWSVGQFQDNVLIPYLGRTKLEKKIISDPQINNESWDKAQEALKRVNEPDADFAEIAKEISEGPSAPDGGDLGEFGRGEMVKEFEDVVFQMEPGQISDIVQTQFGYHIIKLEEKKDDRVHARHILIQPKDFDEWLTEEKDKLAIRKYI